MKKDIKTENCSYSPDLVAYLYDEIDPAGRNLFEAHLADCGMCTDEFAELSFARLDVYEWHRDEFASMETPRFVIPYVNVELKTSWFDAFRGLFAAHGQLATAGGAFALIAIISGAVYVASVNRTDEIASKPGSDIVAANKVKSVDPPSTPVTAKDVIADPPKVVSDLGEVKISTGGKSPVPAKAVDRRPAKAPERNTARRPTAAPRLNDFEDEDDNTLRLGDLLADIDTKY
jgi:hypothetical protein